MKKGSSRIFPPSHISPTSLLHSLPLVHWGLAQDSLIPGQTLGFIFSLEILGIFLEGDYYAILERTIALT